MDIARFASTYYFVWFKLQGHYSPPPAVLLKHTFGRRLRAAGVSFKDRQDLLGHKSGRITTHYSAAELHKLIEAANSVCDRRKQSPILGLLQNKNSSAQVTIDARLLRNPTNELSNNIMELKAG